MSAPDGFAQLNDNAVTLLAAPTEASAPEAGRHGDTRCRFGVHTANEASVAVLARPMLYARPAE